MRSFFPVTLLTLGLAAPALADSWTPAWMASPQAVWSDTSVFETGLPDSIADVTIRQPLTLGYSAGSLRLVLSNIHGTRPLPVEAVTLARSRGGPQVEASQQVLFGGRPAALIAPGAELVSDPVRFAVEAGERVAATLTFGPDAVAQDFHWDARETSYVIDADEPAPKVLSEMPGASDPQRGAFGPLRAQSGCRHGGFHYRRQWRSNGCHGALARFPGQGSFAEGHSRGERRHLWRSPAERRHGP